jgi:hypothetical protein
MLCFALPVPCMHRTALHSTCTALPCGRGNLRKSLPFPDHRSGSPWILSHTVQGLSRASLAWRLEAGLIGRLAAIPVQQVDQSGCVARASNSWGTGDANQIQDESQRPKEWGFAPFAAFERHRLFWNFFGASEWPSSPPRSCRRAACLPCIS